MKKCSRCQVDKEPTATNFHKDKNKKDGLSAICKECKRKEYQKNKGEIKKQLNKERAENREYHQKKREAYRRKNAQKIAERESRYYQANREKLIELSRKHYKSNREYILKRNSTYGKNNPQVSRRSKQRRKALSLKLSRNLTEKDWLSAKGYFNNSCAYCGTGEDEHVEVYGEILHQDHFIPINAGGGYTKDNIVPACKSCNSSKRDSDFHEWYIQQENYSKENEADILNYLGYKNKTKQLSIL